MTGKTKLMLLLGLLSFGMVGCYHSPEDKADYMVSKVTRKLDLNEAQVAKLEKIKVAFLAELKAQVEKTDEKKQMINEFLMADQIEADKIKERIDERRKEMDTKFDQYFPLVADFHASLNKEQKEKLQKFANKMLDKRKRRWE